MKLFLDTNIIMDFVKCREPFIYEALPLIQQGEKGIHQLFISDLTFVNVAYLSKKGLLLYQLYEMLEEVYSLFEVVSIGKQAIKMALDLKYTDFEDECNIFQRSRQMPTASSHETRKTLLFQTYRYTLLPSLWKILYLPNRFRTNLKRFRTRFLFPFIRFSFALPINGNAVYDIL